jgi:hypothetical protein
VEAAREKRIRQFREEQLKKRQWICFEEIADYCARSTSIKASEDLQVETYNQLLKYMLDGGFDINGVMQVRYLCPDRRVSKDISRTPPITRAYVQKLVELHPDDKSPHGEVVTRPIQSGFLAFCWVPNALCLQWFQTYRQPFPESWRLNVADEPTTLLAGESKSRVGRKDAYDWGEAVLFIEKVLNERGDFAEPENAMAGWRSQADLERLVVEHMSPIEGKEPAVSTIRRRVTPTLVKWRLEQVRNK